MDKMAPPFFSKQIKSKKHINKFSRIIVILRHKSLNSSVLPPGEGSTIVLEVYSIKPHH